MENMALYMSTQVRANLAGLIVASRQRAVKHLQLVEKVWGWRGQEAATSSGNALKMRFYLYLSGWDTTTAEGRHWNENEWGCMSLNTSTSSNIQMMYGGWCDTSLQHHFPGSTSNASLPSAVPCTLSQLVSSHMFLSSLCELGQWPSRIGVAQPVAADSQTHLRRTGQ